MLYSTLLHLDIETSPLLALVRHPLKIIMPLPKESPSCRFLSTLQELVRAYQAFDAVSSEHIRSLGLTTSQFDVIATLGNTHGLSCRDIGSKTLMVKGTLTGVLDRLERKGFIRRAPHPEDGRSSLVRLSDTGEALFQRIFPDHMAFLDTLFAPIPTETLDILQQHLHILRQTLDNHPSSEH